MSTARELRDLWGRSRAAVTDAVNRYRAAQASDPTNLDRLREQSRAMSQERLASICSSLALRNLNLVDLAIEQLEKIYEQEDDPDKLTSLYQIDNLAIRLRRNAENLRVLAGRDNEDSSSESASLVDLLRAALSSIRQHDRIALAQVASIGIVGPVAADVGRVLTELLDNAANNSPPTSQVRASAHLTETGSVLIRIEDDGLGLTEGRIGVLNRRMTSPAALDRDAVRHMGLAVVASLAHQHRLRVQLQRRVPQGTTATVTIPNSLICEIPTGLWSGGSTVSGVSRGGRPAMPNRPTMDASPRQATTTERRIPPASTVTASTAAPASTAKAPAVKAPAASTPSRGEPIVGAVTSSGLPRRIPASLRGEAGQPDGPSDAVPTRPIIERPAQPPADERAGNERMFADLGAFERGQRAAEQPENSTVDDPRDAGIAGDLGNPDGPGHQD